MLDELAKTIRASFALAAWMIVEADEIAGLCSVIRPVENGGIAIGYGHCIHPYGPGACATGPGRPADLGQGRSGVPAIAAETYPDYLPSQQVLVRNGFLQTGRRMDPEDGEVICWTAVFPPTEVFSEI